MKVVLKVKVIKKFVVCCVKMKSVGEGVVKFKVLSVKVIKGVEL